MHLSKEETKRLDSLYVLANEYDDDQSWDSVDRFFLKMSQRYQFDPKRNIITGRGVIEEISKCNKCGEIANTTSGVNYEKVKDNFKWVSKPICYSCKVRFYNGK